MISNKHRYFNKFFRFKKLRFKLYTNSYLVLRLIEKIAHPTFPGRSDFILRIHDVKPKKKIPKDSYFKEKRFRFGKTFYKIAIVNGINRIKGYNIANGINRIKGYHPSPRVRDIFVYQDFLDSRSFLVNIKRTLTLYEINNLLKKELSVLHASAVALNGKGILFIGGKGVGKSTIALNLLKNGFNFISDDRSFLKLENDLINVLGLDRTIKLTQNSLSFLSRNQKKDYIVEMQIRRRKHYRFEIRNIISSRWIKKSPARFLFFVSNYKNKKQFVKMPPIEALNMLLSKRLFYSPFKDTQKLDFLIKLIKQTKQYRLYRGSLSELPMLLKKL